MVGRGERVLVLAGKDRLARVLAAPLERAGYRPRAGRADDLAWVARLVGEVPTHPAETLDRAVSQAVADVRDVTEVVHQPPRSIETRGLRPV